MDTHQQRRQDGEEQAKEMQRDQACRLEPHPGGADQGRQDQDNKENGINNIMDCYFKF